MDAAKTALPTARNPLMSRIKRAMSAPVYARCREALAAGGEPAVEAVLARHLTPAGVATIMGRPVEGIDFGDAKEVR